MIRKIKADGFKSLSNFELELNPGLNILIGPNGSGKTNITAFLEFISNIYKSNLSHAIAQAGGVSSILRKTQDYAEKIEFSITGETRNGNENEGSIGTYQLDAIISFNIKEGKVFFEQQHLVCDYSNFKLSEGKGSEFVFKCDITVINNGIGNQSSVVREWDMGDYKRFKNGNRRLRSPASRYSKKNIESEITNFSFGDELVISALYFLAGPIMYRFFNGELRGGMVLNIEPRKAKSANDISTEVGLLKDGYGLAATLYHLKNDGSAEDKHKLNSEFETISKYARMANSSISSLNPHIDLSQNKIVLDAVISSEGRTNSILPATMLSDGTIKWIALITALYTSNIVLAIEEPENYLHPWMQSEIVSIMRDASQENRNSFFVLTTHSETLLNEAAVEEIILVRFELGRTIASRVSNRDMVNVAIKKSGLGLGAYYKSDMLETLI